MKQLRVLLWSLLAPHWQNNYHKPIQNQLINLQFMDISWELNGKLYLPNGIMLPGYDDFKIIEYSWDQWLQSNKFTIIDLAKGLLMQFMKLIWHESYQLNRLIFIALTTKLKKWICHQRWQKHWFLMHCLTCRLDLVWWLRVVPPSVMSLSS